MPLAAGVYTRVRRWITDSNASIAIEPDLHDTEDDSIASALNLAWYRDGQAAATANMPMGGFKFTNLADGSGNADSVSLGQANSVYLLKAQLAAGLPVNASITSSVAGNALTIALKTGAGADASSASSILLPFRSATATDGTVTVVAVTAATSLVISSGSTLATSNNNPFRIWVVLFNDAGVIRLGAMRSVGNAAVDSIRTLSIAELASSTAEGGAGAADSGRTFYTGTAVTSKPYCILGYLEWNAGLATAGTWASDATHKQVYGPGCNLPGDLVQGDATYDISSATGTTVLPFDNTTPQNTEGDQYMSLSFTALSSCNRITIEHVGFYASNGIANTPSVAFFIDTTANAIQSFTTGRVGTAGVAQQISAWTLRSLTDASSHTYKVRAGFAIAGTTTFNGTAGAGLFNNTLLSHLVIKEFRL